MSPQVPTQVALVSDDRLLCDGLSQSLSEQPDFRVTICCPGLEWSVAQLAGEHDIILVDARNEHAWPLGRAIPRGVGVIFVGASEDDAWASAALVGGAGGSLPCTASRADLIQAIRVVRGGGIWARRRWLNACVLQIAEVSRRRTAVHDTLDARLSRREREVLEHAATGVGNKELAERLSISEATVKVHLTHIFQKLGVPGRAALAAAYHHVGTIGHPVDDDGRTTNGVLR